MKDDEYLYKFMSTSAGPTGPSPSQRPHGMTASASVKPAQKSSMTEEQLSECVKQSLRDLEEVTRMALKDMKDFDKRGKVKINTSDLYVKLEQIHATVEQLILDAPELLDSALYGNMTNEAISELRKWLGE